MGTLLVAGAVEEVCGGLFDEGKFEAEGFAEVCVAFVTRKALDAIMGDPAFFNETLQTDKERIAREGRESRVRESYRSPWD